VCRGENEMSKKKKIKIKESSIHPNVSLDRDLRFSFKEHFELYVTTNTIQVMADPTGLRKMKPIMPSALILAAGECPVGVKRT
jgi:hypothetical protein